MATKSFTNEQNFTKKGATELLKSFERSERMSVALAAPTNTVYIKKNSEQFKKFVKGLKVDQ